MVRANRRRRRASTKKIKIKSMPEYSVKLNAVTLEISARGRATILKFKAFETKCFIKKK